MNRREFKITYGEKDHPVFHAILVSNGIVDRTFPTVDGDNYFVVLHDPWIKQVYDLLCDCNEANITIIVSKAIV
jgi:hypothetical protein